MGTALNTIKILAAGVAVYLGVAACSAASSTQERLAQTGGAAGSTAQPGGAGGAPGGSATGGQLSGGSGGLVQDSGLDAFADAMGDAMGVPDADAAPPGATVVTAACDKTYPFGGGQALYAEVAFPGKLADDLATVVVVLDYASSPEIPGYTRRVQAYASIRDGFAAVTCGYSGSPNNATGATFILP